MTDTNRAMDKFKEKFASRLQSLMDQQREKNKANILLLGKSGVGKTHLLRTAPGPVYVHSFDPGGQDTNAHLFGPKYVVHSKFENITYQKPNGFSSWEDEMKFLIQEDFFSNVGTFVLDSITGWSRAMSYYISNKMASSTKAGHQGREHGRLHLSDYNVTINVTISWIHQLLALPCHVILVGHLTDKWDHKSGAWLGNDMLFVGQKVIEEIINSLSEIYVIKANMQHGTNETKVTRELLTSPNKFFEKAKTRRGGDSYLSVEKPDLRYLFSKAGFDTEDLPPFDFS